MEKDPYIQKTKHWLEMLVIGQQLCPFAQAPYRHGKVRFVATPTSDPAKLLERLAEELLYLAEVEPQLVETTLLIHPGVLLDFGDYLDFLPRADWMLQQYALEGVIQIASFHPAYQFEGTEPDDVTNYTNRSPYPMLHLLREESIERAVAEYPDPERIPERNIERMRRLGAAGIARLLSN